MMHSNLTSPHDQPPPSPPGCSAAAVAYVRRSIAERRGYLLPLRAAGYSSAEIAALTTAAERAAEADGQPLDMDVLLCADPLPAPPRESVYVTKGRKPREVVAELLARGNTANEIAAMLQQLQLKPAGRRKWTAEAVRSLRPKPPKPDRDPSWLRGRAARAAVDPLLMSGLTFELAAEALNDAGKRTSSGILWNHQSVWNVAGPAARAKGKLAAEKLERAEGDPTEEEIAQHCRKIQDGWTRRERTRRAGFMPEDFTFEPAAIEIELDASIFAGLESEVAA